MRKREREKEQVSGRVVTTKRYFSLSPFCFEVMTTHLLVNTKKVLLNLLTFCLECDEKRKPTRPRNESERQ
jgi:hypothetical protein